jgi:hypothetical protein
VRRLVALSLILAGYSRDAFHTRDDVPMQRRQCHEPMACLYFRCTKRAWFVAGECESWEADAACYPCPRGR